MRHTPGLGELTVFTGCMASRKTAYMIIDLMQIAESVQARCCSRKRVVVAIKSILDTRSPPGKITSRLASLEFPATTVHSAGEILEVLPDSVTDVGIDEGHFFDDSLVAVVETLQRRNIEVAVAGLDLDYLRRPFPVMAELIVKANRKIKLPARCTICWEPAYFSQRLDFGQPAKRSPDRIVVEGASKNQFYEPRCLLHHVIPD